MQPSAPSTLTAEAAETIMNAPAADPMGGWLDRLLSVGYGVVYDYVYPRFRHYQRLQAEVRDLVEAAVPTQVERRDVRVLEIACGPGNFTCALVEGLSGKAAKAGNGAVYLHHLDAYVTDRVKELSKGKQHPVSAKPTTIRSFPLSKP